MSYETIAALRNDTKPHGCRARYAGGCRCFYCRRANSAYARERKLARRCGDKRHLVRADRARAHLCELSGAGLTRIQVATAAQISPTTISQIKRGSKIKLRAHVEARILAIVP